MHYTFGGADGTLSAIRTCRGKSDRAREESRECKEVYRCSLCTPIEGRASHKKSLCLVLGSESSSTYFCKGSQVAGHGTRKLPYGGMAAYKIHDCHCGLAGHQRSAFRAAHNFRSFGESRRAFLVAPERDSSSESPKRTQSKAALIATHCGAVKSTSRPGTRRLR